MSLKDQDVPHVNLRRKCRQQLEAPLKRLSTGISSSSHNSPTCTVLPLPTLWRRKPRCAQVTLKSRAAWLHSLSFNSIYCSSSIVQMVLLGPSHTYLSRKGRQTDRQTEVRLVWRQCKGGKLEKYV